MLKLKFKTTLLYYIRILFCLSPYSLCTFPAGLGEKSQYDLLSAHSGCCLERKRMILEVYRSSVMLVDSGPLWVHFVIEKFSDLSCLVLSSTQRLHFGFFCITSGKGPYWCGTTFGNFLPTVRTVKDKAVNYSKARMQH